MGTIIIAPLIQSLIKKRLFSENDSIYPSE